ncbi:hypothetical protein [Aureimonas pseudogalii]|uniref:Flagellar basal body-associated protein FliL n=1 Tax=Aureimonas pseudogalii TaxID=1744844 RepID=A0A7W6E7W5_9HYPH|nr:hypothetical protein [Aureimonas pseudogalii]MBB3996381.1 flagellar basal body-associated protein FliL [Aureimonas pseudogalii]
MIKILGIGIWVCVVALGTSYAVATMRSSETTAAPKEADYFEGLDYRKTDGIAVPLIAENAIQGYVLARFVYTIDGETAAKLAVPPDPIILDEAFRAVYSVSGFDFRNPERYDLQALLGSIKESVNKRYGQKVVEDVMVDQFDFMPKNQLGGEIYKTADVKKITVPE